MANVAGKRLEWLQSEEGGGGDEKDFLCLVAALDSGHGGRQQLVKVGCAQASGGVPALGRGPAVGHLASL